MTTGRAGEAGNGTDRCGEERREAQRCDVARSDKAWQARHGPEGLDTRGRAWPSEAGGTRTGPKRTDENRQGRRGGDWRGVDRHGENGSPTVKSGSTPLRAIPQTLSTRYHNNRR